MTTSRAFLDSLLATPRVVGVFVSPDGRWVAWTWANMGAHRDVYIASTDGSQKPRKITDFEQDTFITDWAPDSSALIVIHDYAGDERDRLYKVARDGSTVTPLTEERPDYFVRGGQLHPNGRFLVYGANYDFERKEEIESTVIYRHDLVSGERKPIAHPERSGYSVPSINTAGTYIIYRRNDLDPSGAQVWLTDIDGLCDVEILNYGAKKEVDASWIPHENKIIFLAEAEGYRKVGVYDVDTETTTMLIDDPHRNSEDEYVPYGSEYAVVIETIQAVDQPSLLHLGTHKETKLDLPHAVLPCAPVGDNEWACLFYNSQQPNDIVVCPFPEGEIARRITNVYEHVDYQPDDLSRAEGYKWQSTDGRTIHGWLYRPQGERKGTIVCVHGGPTSHGEDAFTPQIQYFVSEGFTVLDPNYRGSTGYGLAFQELIKEDGWGGMEQVDIVEAVKSLVDDGIAEKGTIGITGTSYGGYSSWCAITHTPPEYIKASVPICGMTDLVTDYYSTRPDLRNYSEAMLGGSPKTAPDTYHDRSPIHFVQNIKGDVLIVQGLKDPNVTYENVKDVEKQCKTHDISYETLFFEDEGHGISKPKNQKLLYSKMVKFFKRSFGV